MTLLQAANVAADTEAEELFLARVGGDEDLYLPPNRDAVNAHLRNIHRYAHMSMREICTEVGINQTDLSRLTGIPLRTIQNWCADPDAACHRDAPAYLRCLILLALGLLDPPYPTPEPEEETDDFE